MSDKRNIEFLQERIKAARRQIPSDLVLKKGRVTGVQVFFKSENKLDSGFRRNDGKGAFPTFSRQC
jgi:hypothetical protein